MYSRKALEFQRIDKALRSPLRIFNMEDVLSVADFDKIVQSSPAVRVDFHCGYIVICVFGSGQGLDIILASLRVCRFDR